VRHFVDSYLILVVHRKEMESKLRIFNEIVMVAIVSLCIYQSVMLAYFYLNDCSYQSAIMGILLAITIMVLIMNIEEVYDPIKIDFENMESDLEVKDQDLQKWREEYTHPLLLNSSGQNTAIFNAEVKDMEQVFERVEELHSSPSNPNHPRSDFEIEAPLP
jgi:hypothetical protein